MTDINYILITEDNKEDFAPLLGGLEILSTNQISIGAYDDDGDVCGIITYKQAGYSVRVEWLYVHPNMRRQGIATGLVREMIKAVGMTENMPIEAEFEVSDDNRGLYDFFISIEDIEVSYSHNRYTVIPKKIKGLKKDIKIKQEISQFFDQPMYKQRLILEKLENTESPYIIDDYQKWSEFCIKPLCRFIEKDDKLVTAIIIQKRLDDNLELAYLYSKKPKYMIKLIDSVLKDVLEKYPESSLVIDAINGNSDKIVRKMFKKYESVHVYEADW